MGQAYQATNINLIVIGFAWSGIEPIWTRGEYANHYIIIINKLHLLKRGKVDKKQVDEIFFYLHLITKWVSKWIFFNAKWAIFPLYRGENKLHLDEMMLMMSGLV
jgi:hypothetical protein